ncbi:MFS transporter [Oceanobacillus kimchii]|uniref:MFS transporter n=1 Tax=Oceanobacillus kimchii TaxID=746691 RepID=UPI0003494A74|nr:MFS transporter [Oceanobacillus kimchii]MCT1577013.1 MFS transporter [Oceanobacillus kimchii]MCT2135083.1 MFS transporter [Oceanobacillus kimchii]
MSNVNHEQLPKATWREWIGLGALTLAVFMLATDMTVLFLAMPSIAADLAPSATQMLWIIHIGEMLAVGFVLTMGRLGDKVGRKRLLIIGASIYGCASLFAAFATEAWMLIATRALIGITAATVMPSTMSLLRSMFTDSKQFSVAIAINLSAFSAGMALGPPIGGLLLDTFWWGAVFLINVPIVIALLLTSPLLPEYRNKTSNRIDFVSVLLSLLTLATLIFGLQEMANHGFHFVYGGSILVGIVTGMLFIRRQKKMEDPLLDLRMFHISSFSFSLIAVMAVLLVTTGADMLFAQHLQAIIGLTPTQAGLLLIIPAFLSMVGTLVSPALTKWLRPAYVMAIGLLTATAGALIIMITVHDGGALILIIGASLAGFGIGPTMTIASEQIVSSVPQERAGSASAMSDVSSGLGSVLSIAFIGSIGMIVYRATLMDSIPSGVPQEIVAFSSENVGSAIVASEGYPDFLLAIQSSFSFALQTVYGIVAVGLFTLMLIILWKFRHVRQDDSTNEEEQAL